jgi:hypothetical protein
MNFCSEYSRDVGEQLFGTAKPVELWLLIEHRGRWERDAGESLPALAKDAVGRLQMRYPAMRLALIRQAGREERELHGFMALTAEAQPQLFGFTFENHEELGSLDFEGVLTGKPMARSLFLVCTHGVHDRCCAKFGNALYQQMDRSAGEDAWQVSHIGGCRFAPNVVVLPQGLVQGRVAADDCDQLVQEASAGRAVPRGRSCYDKPVQAAEYFLRTEAGETGDLRLETVELCDRDWKVVFRSGDEKRTIWMVWMVREDTGVFTYKSCAAAGRSARPEFRLIGRRTESDLGALRTEQLTA